jgi:hypothetical protein
MHILNIVYVEKFPKCLEHLPCFWIVEAFALACLDSTPVNFFRISFRGKTHLILAHIDELLDFLPLLLLLPNWSKV